MRIAWGITGSGDKLRESLEVMKKMKEKYGDDLIIEVFYSIAGLQVAKIYNIIEDVSSITDKQWIEENANTPFLSGRLQMKHFDVFIIAPATSNTVAKLAVGIADTLLTNGALQAVKGYMVVYVMPSDFRAGETTTILPNGKIMKLKIRIEDVENVRKLQAMEGFHVFEKPIKICEIIGKNIGESDNQL
jgi:archaeoflavoprotein AfpA